MPEMQRLWRPAWKKYWIVLRRPIMILPSLREHFSLLRMSWRTAGIAFKVGKTSTWAITAVTAAKTIQELMRQEIEQLQVSITGQNQKGLSLRTDSAKTLTLTITNDRAAKTSQPRVTIMWAQLDFHWHKAIRPLSIKPQLSTNTTTKYKPCLQLINLQ